MNHVAGSGMKKPSVKEWKATLVLCTCKSGLAMKCCAVGTFKS